MLSGRKVLLGVTGSIAAYKTAFLIRLLVKAGAEVKVVMTASAKEFITPLTLSVLSKNPVYSEFFNKESGEWNNHVELAEWADLVLIAPASASTIAKMANGLCDNLLIAVYQSARCPVYLAPAMDVQMMKHKINKNNINILKSAGNNIIDAGYGELASGLTGEGRMAEPDYIFRFIEKDLVKKSPLYGKKALVTAGPTYEAIDRVRFIGNHSSGKMGFAIAQSLARNGAEVTLVAGPVSLPAPPGVTRVDIVSAAQMNKACLSVFNKADIIVMAAAVADFSPAKKSNHKIKKAGAVPALELESTPDILAGLGAKKKSRQVLMGFALETENGISNAKKKLKKKNLDFIVLNTMSDTHSAFRQDTNQVTVIQGNNKITNFELKPKSEVADDLVRLIIEKIKNKK